MNTGNKFLLQASNINSTMVLTSHMIFKDGNFTKIFTNTLEACDPELCLAIMPIYIENKTRWGLLQACDYDGEMKFTYYLTRDGRSFSSQSISYAGQPTSDTHILSADINKDHSSDVIQIWNNGMVCFITYLSSYAQANYITIPSCYNSQYSSSMRFLAADINGDGKMDILQHLSASLSSKNQNCEKIHNMQLISYLSQGDGSFSEVPNYYLFTNCFLALLPLDINGDGYTDILQISLLDMKIPNLAGFISYLSRGNGTFNVVINIYPWSGIDPFNEGLSVLAIDLDEDGQTDIVTHTYATWWGSTRRITSYFSQGDGSFRIVNDTTYTGNYKSSQPISSFAMHVNSDSKLDIVIANHYEDMNANVISTLISHGNGSFSVGDSIVTSANDIAVLPMGDFTKIVLPE